MSDKNKTLVASDYNLQKINTREFSQHLATSLQIGSNLLVIGQRGSGKSVISKTEIAKQNLQEVYLNLSMTEKTDLAGFPKLMGMDMSKEKYVNFLMPWFFKHLIEGDRDSVLLLDEVDKADKELWGALLEIVQFKTINGRPLPKLRSCVMTGNLLSEGGNRPCLPLLDRSERFLLEADVESWLMWSGSDGHIHPSITAYIKDHGNHLFGTPDPENNYADPSPRGWTRASDLLYKGEELNWGTDLLHAKVAGCVGKSVGIEYSSYYTHYQTLLPLVDKIFQDKDILREYNAMEPSKQMVTCMIACSRVASQLDAFQEQFQKTDPDKRKSVKLPPAVEYAGKFMNSISPETALISLRSQIGKDRFSKNNLDEVNGWKQFIESTRKQMGL